MKKEEEQLNKQRKYFVADKLSNNQFLSTIPKELIPTNRTAYILSTIFVLVILIGIGLMLFDAWRVFGELSSLSTNTEDVPTLELLINVGWPWTFLEFDFNQIEKFPLKWGLIPDLLIYFLVAYSLDVLIGVFLKYVKKDKGREKRLAAKPKLQELKTQTQNTPNQNTVQ